MHLPDPRDYARVAPKNALIKATMAALTADAQTKADKQATLMAELQAVLAIADDKALALALSLLPDETATRHFWQQLFTAVAQPDGIQSHVFALPLIWVAAAKDVKQTHPLPDKVPDLSGLRLKLADLGVLPDTPDVWLSDQFLSMQDLVQASPTQIAQWGIDGVAHLPVQAAPSSVKTEAVYLRFLVGTSKKPLAVPAPARYLMALTEYLSAELTARYPNLSILPMVRPVQPLLTALVSARAERQHIALQLYVSNELRYLRSKGAKPIVCYAMHEGGEFRMTIAAEERKERWEAFVWRLHPLDNVAELQQTVESLLRECQVDDAHVAYHILPDQEGDTLPLFLNPTNVGLWLQKSH